MTSSQSVGATGNAYIDGILEGAKWTSSSLTFGFPPSATDYSASYGVGETKTMVGFGAAQQQAARDVLKSYASILDVTFREVAGGSEPDIRYAQSNAPSTAWAYTPTNAPEGGDVWLNADNTGYDNPVKGGYAFMTLLHETGHAMGLKHAHEIEGAFGAMPADHDTLEYTVMSYRSYVGASTTRGFLNGNWDYPQTLMLDDIRALQTLYGANFSNGGRDMVYRWSATTGELSINGVGQGAPGANKVFMTVWTGGAHATYDFSDYKTGLKIDLQPGHWITTSQDQLAHLDARGGDTHIAQGNIANAYLVTEGQYNNLVAEAIGGSGDDTILGNDADNRITGGKGSDNIDGGGGINTAVYSGAAKDYAWSQLSGGAWQIRDLRAGGGDGVDTLKNIGFLQFSDKAVALTAPSQPQNSNDTASPTTNPPASTTPTASDSTAVASPVTPVEHSAGAFEHLLLAAKDNTSVATTTYEFFTGAIPTQQGLEYLLSSDPSGTGLNSPYYANFSVENRYINFAVNLGKLGAGHDWFDAHYAGLLMPVAVQEAYKTIFGAAPSDATLAAIMQPSRMDYFAGYGGDDLGTKAAMVGWLLAEAVKSGQGVYAQANAAFLADVVDGADYNVDLIGVYSAAISH